MDRQKLNKMMNIIEETAHTKWQSMFNTYHYKKAKAILSQEEMTYADKDNLRHLLSALCLCVGLDYYKVIATVYQ